MSARSTAAKLTLIGALYLSQGLPYGFFTQALPVLMREMGHSLEQIGFASLLTLPWALKFLWAPWIDRPWIDRFGSKSIGLRRSWIIPLQLALAALLVAASFFEPRQWFAIVLAIVFFVNALSATQDIATDALAVDILNHRERGLGNGVQVAAYRMGMIVGGGVLLIAFAQVGWRASFFSMAFIVVLATVPTWLHREVPIDVRDVVTPNGSSVHFLRLPGIWPLLAMLFLLKFGETAATTMLRPFLVDQGLSLKDIGWMVGTIGFISGLVGALVGGWLAGRVRRKAALIACTAIQAVALGTYVIAATQPLNEVLLASLIGIEHLAGGMATAALFTCMMDWCRPGRSGTDYTVQASTVVIASSIAAATSGAIAQHLGYAGLFAVAFALGIVALGAVVLLFPRQPSISSTYADNFRTTKVHPK